jgi:hypothetical protein
MPLLIDLALAVLVLAGALFLGSVGLALFKELSKGNGNDKTPPSSK